MIVGFVALTIKASRMLLLNEIVALTECSCEIHVRAVVINQSGKWYWISLCACYSPAGLNK